MLQQTTVAAVVPYFERFLNRFPDVTALASAPIDDVLRLWEGLGYYSRARNLHKAACVIVSQHHGSFPSDAELLLTLPGIGRYTAGAIASFAFDLPAAIVEANTERLYARLIALPQDVKSSRSQRALWAFASSIMPRHRSGDFNQALMDIGSQVCKPVEPSCDRCPLTFCCQAFAQGTQNELPVRKARTPVTAMTEVSIVIRNRNRFLLRRRTSQERWAGMWDFVRFEIDEADVDGLPDTDHSHAAAGQRRGTKKKQVKQKDNSLPKSIVDRIRCQTGLLPGPITGSTEFSYSVTRYRVRLKCYVCSPRSETSELPDGQQWFTARQLVELPLSKTGRKIADWATTQLPPGPRKG